MARTLIAAAVTGALLTLTACQSQQQGASFIRRPLNKVESDRDRLYVACIRNDPFFKSDACRDLQGGR